MVTIEITGGPTLTFPWAEKMTGQIAMETAFNTEQVAANGSRTFIFMLQYYGALGYLVDMINGTFDTFSFQNNVAHPYFFWDFEVNGKDSTAGIDNTPINDGDVITFNYEIYPPLAGTKPNLTAKFNAKTSN
jgi:Domain of unknown function (DUF4430)